MVNGMVFTVTLMGGTAQLAELMVLLYSFQNTIFHSNEIRGKA
jgi:hypothetical protein